MSLLKGVRTLKRKMKLFNKVKIKIIKNVLKILTNYSTI